MELTLFLEYGWVLLVLVVMEGLLAADNALVLALMVKHLPENMRKKALFYGLAGAFVFRFTSLFAGGMIGLIIMRFAANMFVNLLEKSLVWKSPRLVLSAGWGLNWRF